MSQLPNMVIVMSRCSRSREPFGMRFEELSQGLWVTDWAFPVRENTAKKEGYDQSDIKGAFASSDEYPSFPFCKGDSVIYCSRCGKVSCYDGSSGTARRA